MKKKLYRLILPALLVVSLTACNTGSWNVDWLDKWLCNVGQADACAAVGTTQTPPPATGATPTPQPAGSTPVPSGPTATPSAGGNVSMGWNTPWYWSPFRDTTSVPTDELARETFAEPGMFPGMLMDSGEWAQTAWDQLNDAEEYLLVREAGYAYMASNGYCLDVVEPEASDISNTEIRSHLYCLPEAEETIYFTIVRGLFSDGGDADRNRIVVFSNYTRGAAIYHGIDAGAYVSLNWVSDQIANAQNVYNSFSDPNSGDNGSKNRYLVVTDLDTQTVRIWSIAENDATQWTRVADWAIFSD